MTSPSPQVPAPKKKSNTALIVVIVALLSLFVILPLCVILSIVAIIALDPAGNRTTPTEAPIGTEELISETITPTSVTSKEDPYLGWQTFESVNLGISFKYPASFNVLESESGVQVFTEGNSGSRPLQITVHNAPFDQEFFRSHNLRQEENDRTIQIGDEMYTTSYFFSGEGSPRPTPGETWEMLWETELVEIGQRTILIEVSTESIFNQNTNTERITNTASQEDIENSELILKSMVFN